MSTVKANTYQDASGGSNAQLYGVASPPNSMGFRNRIINGDMRVNQRDAVTTIDGTNSTYSVDRWAGADATDGVFTLQQGSSAPTGFVNSLLATVTTADASLGATQRSLIIQYIEGNNIADLNWGTVNAQSVTLSFWVRCSLTGTFGAALLNSAEDRSYPFNYTISAANTWEYKTVTIPGDTAGTWLTTNGIGIGVHFNLGTGSTYSGTANAWAATRYYTPTGAQSVIGTNGATFYLTGVQLEAGTNASPFERRPYGTELALCQRYYYRLDPASATNDVAAGYNANTGSGRYIFSFPVTMRAEPSAIETSGTNSDYAIVHGVTTTNCDAQPVFANATKFTARINASVAATPLTAGQGSLFRINTATAYLGWSAEL